MKALFTVLLLFLLNSAFAQAPESYMNIGIGTGPNYGILGVKTVTGFKNSGLMLGLGSTFDGHVGFEIGGQFSLDHWFINAGYGTYGSRIKDQYNTIVDKTYRNGVLVNTGGMINMGKAKTFFIEIGVGAFFATQQISSLEPIAGLTGQIGVGYRLTHK